MITTSEFLYYVRKQSTKQTYSAALGTYLKIIEAAKQNEKPQAEISQNQKSLDQRWSEYLTKTQDPWKEMELFVQKAKELGLTPKTINLYIEVVQLYFRECNIETNRRQEKRIKKLSPKNHPLTRDNGLTHKTIQELLNHANTRQRAIILIAVSSGMRIGEILKTEINDIDLEKSPAEIYIPAANTKTETPRVAFISKEAATAVREWMDVRNTISKKSDARVFPYTRSYESKKFQSVLLESGNAEKDKETNRYLIHFHSFRKFFLTEFKLAACAEVAEELAGHAGYLSESYRRITYQTMQDEYRKAESRLTIFGGKTDMIAANTRKTDDFKFQAVFNSGMFTDEVKVIQTEILALYARVEKIVSDK